MNETTRNTLLTVVTIVLLLVAGYLAYALYQQQQQTPAAPVSTNENPADQFDPAVVQYLNYYPDLATNDAYTEASFAFTGGDYDRSRDLFLEAAQNTGADKDAALMIEGQAAVSALSAEDYSTAARLYVNAIANDTYPSEGNYFKSNYVRMLAVSYADSNFDEEVFTIIFKEDPDLFAIETKAYSEMTVADHEQALTDLLEISARGKYQAPIEYEMTYVNNKISLDFALYDAFFQSCRNSFDPSTGACSPDTETILTTPEEREIYTNLEVEVADVVARYENGTIEAQSVNDASLFTAYLSLAQFVHKALYYGFTDEALVRSVNEDLLEVAQYVGIQNAQQAQMEFAIFLALSFSESSDRSEIASTLAPLHEEGSRLYLTDDELADFMTFQNDAYNQVVSGSYRDLDLIEVRSQVALSLYDPVHKERLERVLGWDFTDPAIVAVTEKYFPNASN